MIKQLLALMLTVSVALAITTSTHAAKAPKSNAKKASSVTGVIVQVTKTMIVVDAGTDKPKRVSAQITDATTFSGAEAVQGATATISLKDGKATSVDVQAATSK